MRVRRSVVFALAAAGVFAAPPSARAADAESKPAPPFGAAGQLVFDDVVGFGARSAQLLSSPPLGAGFSGLVAYLHDGNVQGIGGTLQRSSYDVVTVAPTFDVFVAPRLSIGLELGVSWAEQRQTGAGSDSSDATTLSFGALPRIGYVIPLGTTIALWPRMALGGGAGHTSGSGAFRGGHSTGEVAALEVPLVLRLHRYAYASLEADVAVAHTSSSEPEFPYDDAATMAHVSGFAGAGLVF